MVFGVDEFNYVSHIWLGHTVVAMTAKICDFQQKIGYNSACAGDTPQMFAPTTTAVAMVTKNWEFYQKICHNFGCIYDGSVYYSRRSVGWK